jgi:GABA permease
MSKHKVLIVANRGVDSPELIEGLRRRGAVESARVTLLVPAVPRRLAWATDMKAGWSEAMDRAEVAAEQMRHAEIEFDGAIVGDPDPFAAVGDVLHSLDFDEVIVAKPPLGISRWLRPSLAGRLRKEMPLPVAEMTIRPREERPVVRLREAVGAAS